MRLTDLHVATMMLSRSEQEAARLTTSLRTLSKLRLPVVVADGGSPQRVVDYVASLPGVSLINPPKHGLVPQVRTALRAAYAGGEEFILYTEPDKQGFFETGLPRFVEDAPDAKDIGIVIAARTDESLATYPSIQQLAERTINELTSRAVGQPGDYSYGPFLIRRELAAIIEQVPDSLGWGWRHFVFILARRMGLRVVISQGDFTCPADQLEELEADRLHRVRQLDQNLEGSVLATKTQSPQLRASRAVW